MIRLPLHASLLSAAMLILCAHAVRAQNDPSVLVQLTQLQKGSLPQLVTAYGRIQAAPSAGQTIMAPISAVVGSLDVQPGEVVAQGAPLLHLMPSPSTAASYAQAQSALHVAEELVTRTRDMLAQHLATAQQLADAQKARSDARAALDALKAQGADGPQILRAPFPAIVASISTAPGSIVAPGTALIQLARSQGLVLQVGLIPDLAASVKAGDQASIAPLGGGAATQGQVLFRGAAVGTTDGLIPVDITVPAGQFFLGEAAQTSITTGQLAGYIVPHDAILVNDQGQTYVVQSINMTARKVTVQVLGSKGGQDVITGSLDPGAPLVLSGNHQLDDGMKMRVADTTATSAP